MNWIRWGRGGLDGEGGCFSTEDDACALACARLGGLDIVIALQGGAIDFQTS